MYRGVIAEQIDPQKTAIEQRIYIQEQARHYVTYRREYDILRRAWLDGRITVDELRELRALLKSGRPREAMLKLEARIAGDM